MSKFYRANKDKLICDILQEAERYNLEDEISFTIADKFIIKAMKQLKRDYDVTLDERILILRKFRAYCEKAEEAKKEYNRAIENFL